MYASLRSVVSSSRPSSCPYSPSARRNRPESLMSLPISGHKAPFQTASFGSTRERRRLEPLSLPTAYRPAPIATTRIHFGVRPDAEGGNRDADRRLPAIARSARNRGVGVDPGTTWAGRCCTLYSAYVDTDDFDSYQPYSVCALHSGGIESDGHSCRREERQ